MTDTELTQQAEMAAAEKAVVVAAKVWLSAPTRHLEPSEETLVDAILLLEALESAATQALPKRGKTTLLTGVHYRGRAVPSRVEDEKENNLAPMFRAGTAGAYITRQPLAYVGGDDERQPEYPNRLQPSGN